MPFALKEKTVSLTFEGGDFEGLEVVCRANAPLADLIYFNGLAVTEDTGISDFGDAVIRFGDQFLVSWNLVDASGADYPATGQALTEVPDARLAFELMKRWGEAVSNPSAPLGQPSSSGNSSEEPLTKLLADQSESLTS